MLKKIYVDEAGNSGPNYLDEKDPYFILAGWIDINDEMKKSDNIKEFTLLLDGKEGKIYTYLHAYWYRYLVDALIYERQKETKK